MSSPESHTFPSTSHTFPSTNDELESSDSSFLKSLEHSPEESEDSQTNTLLLELTTQMAKVKLAHKNHIISKLILNSYKGVLDDKNSKISHEAVKIAKDTILTDKLQKCTEMKSSSRKSYALLGLENCFPERKRNLSAQETSQLRTSVLKDLGEKIEEFKDKKKNIKEVFFNDGLQGQPMVDQAEGYLEKIDKYHNLYLKLNQTLSTLAPQLMENAELMAELNYYQNKIHCLEQKMSLPLVKSKAEMLNCATRILKEKTDLLDRKNQNQINYLNASGRGLQKSLNSIKEIKSSLESRLDSYRRKETHSVAFRGLVNDYNKTYKELENKTCTLSILNDSAACTNDSAACTNDSAACTNDSAARTNDIAACTNDSAARINDSTARINDSAARTVMHSLNELNSFKLV